ncbi:type II toxin-antitoxin system RelE/ParE family toxin [Pseudomonas chlororaphis]|uniref:type II toxin-antitoxin system RelE/ParE family toxin n=1 Tax=Pseudomonas chlororaphis TaxID=587753 RepID=UPI0011CE5D30|nr:type II toxin-antitoxin system RelE/ParE family toxin [Pseudomonas chlororaphis]
MLESAAWTVAAVQEVCDGGGYSCPLTESFGFLGPNYEKSLAGMMSLLEKFSVHGRKMLNDGICHEVDESEKIFEFIKGDLRVLWFYGKGNKIIICSHCFIKKTRKTPSTEKSIAIASKREYFDRLDRKIEVPLFFEE